MSQRKVHFSVPLHQIEYLDKQWEAASRLARDGSDWLRMGLDRLRFNDRIERTGEILKEILDSELRNRIYKERFENFVVPETGIESTTEATTAVIISEIAAITTEDTPTNTSTTTTINSTSTTTNNTSSTIDSKDGGPDS